MSQTPANIGGASVVRSAPSDSAMLPQSDIDRIGLPAGGRWFFRQDPMLELYRGEECKGFTVAWDKLNGKKLYGLFPSAEQFFAALMQNPERRRFAYELIPHGRQCKGYFDIEWEGPPDPSHLRIKAAIAEIRAHVLDATEKRPEIHVACGTRPVRENHHKHSYHIVLDNIVFESNCGSEMRRMLNLTAVGTKSVWFFTKPGTDEPRSIQDLAVYTKNRLFRLPLCCKSGLLTPLRYITEDCLDDTLDEAHEQEYVDLMPMLLTQITGRDILINEPPGGEPVAASASKHKKTSGVKRAADSVDGGSTSTVPRLMFDKGILQGLLIKCGDTASLVDNTTYIPDDNKWKIQCRIPDGGTRQCILRPSAGITHAHNNCLLFVIPSNGAFRIEYRCMSPKCNVRGAKGHVIGFVRLGARCEWTAVRNGDGDAMDEDAVVNPPADSRRAKKDRPAPMEVDDVPANEGEYDGMCLDAGVPLTRQLTRKELADAKADAARRRFARVTESDDDAYERARMPISDEASRSSVGSVSMGRMTLVSSNENTRDGFPTDDDPPPRRRITRPPPSSDDEDGESPAFDPYNDDLPDDDAPGDDLNPEGDDDDPDPEDDDDDGPGGSESGDTVSSDEAVDPDDTYANTYERVKARFEKRCFKVLDPFCFARIKKGSRQLQVYSFTEFRQNYTSMKFWGKGKDGEMEQKKFILAWMEDCNICTYEGIKVDPTNKCKGYYNLWTGFRAAKLPKVSLAEEEEAMRPFKDHILTVIARGVEAHADWFLDLLANMLQRPERRGQVVVSMFGKQGCGKNICINFFREKVLGPDCSYQTASPEHDILGRFAQGLVNHVMVQVDEVGNLHEFADKLKNIVTSDTINYEKKHKDILSVANISNLFMTSNNDNALRVATDDRRTVIFHCDERYAGNKAHFTNLQRLLDRPFSARGVYQALMKRDLSAYPVDFQVPSVRNALYFIDVAKRMRVDTDARLALSAPGWAPNHRILPRHAVAEHPGRRALPLGQVQRGAE